ncbi:hypothetical protein D5281_25320, partial [bacterium 1xD42-62]|nr:hypothetical protein [Parablautia muri]
RLTRSGLSMTDWKFTGSLPPLSNEEWLREFSSDVGYLSRSFCNSIMYDGIIKDLTFSNSVCNLL